jgi:hypothetical protein
MACTVKEGLEALLQIVTGNIAVSDNQYTKTINNKNYHGLGKSFTLIT